MESSDTELLLASQTSTPPRVYARSRSRTITSRTPQKSVVMTPTKLLMEAVSDLYVLPKTAKFRVFQFNSRFPVF